MHMRDEKHDELRICTLRNKSNENQECDMGVDG